jgi:hypothetical protein
LPHSGPIKDTGGELFHPPAKTCRPEKFNHGDPPMKYLICLILLVLFSTPIQAQSLSSEARADIEITRAMINDKRNTALAFGMSFTDEERDAFWPLYRQYRSAMNNVGSRKLDVIIDYADHYEDMTQDKARELLDRHMIYEEQALKVKQLYIEKFRLVLPNTKVTRLMQIENRMDDAIALKLAEGIPLME